MTHPIVEANQDLEMYNVGKVISRETHTVGVLTRPSTRQNMISASFYANK